MNTPTPETDAEEKYFNSNKFKRSIELQSIYNFARKLERERDEARAKWHDSYSAASVAAERDQLRKVADELAKGLNLISSWSEGDVVNSSFDEPSSAETARITLMTSSYNSLPHVIAQKGNKTQ